VLADGPLAYWRLGESSGTVAADSSGHGLDGTYKHATLGIPGALAHDSNTSARFNGTSAALDAGNDPSLRLNGSFTIEFWARQVSFTHQNPGIFEKGPGGDKDSYVLNAKADGQLYLKRNNKLISSGTGALTASFKYFVLTYDGTFARWYVNGVLSTTSAIALPASNGIQALQIGKGQDAGNNDLDEVALYPTALSAARIAAHYASGS
jgi:hypothetical protein